MAVSKQPPVGGNAGASTPLAQFLTQGKLSLNPEQTPYAIAMVNELLEQISAAGASVGKDPLAFIQSRINQIDQLIAAQLDPILHNPSLQKLEASWRGLNYLVMNTETSVTLKIRLLNLSRDELQDDLEKAVEFDQSALFKKVYEEEYGTFGGNPYSCLVADFAFDSTSPDMDLLTKLSGVAAAALAPLIAEASPALFNLDSFAGLGKPRDLAMIFESADKIKWQSFRETEDSRYVALVLPKVLMRLPYGPNTLPVEGLNYTETVDAKGLTTFVWGSAAYMLTQRITNAFSLYGLSLIHI